MSRIKLGILSALMVVSALAVSGLATSSASAAVFELTAEPCSGTGIVALCWDSVNKGTNLRELKGSQTFEALKDVEEAGEESLLLTKLGELEVHIVCVDAHAEGTISQASPLVSTPTLSSPKIVFTECKLLETLGKKCKVPATLETKEITGTTPGVGEVLFKPTVGTTFIEFEISNNGAEVCPATVKGVRKITGEQTCLWLELEVDLPEHLLFCPTEDSKLKFIEQPAELLLAVEVKLVGLVDEWDVTLA